MTPGIMRRRWAGSITAALVLSLTVLAVGAGGAAAQESSTLISNTGQATHPTAERHSDRDHSQAFTTGAAPEGYNITSVAFEIRLNNPSGTTEPTFEVRIQAADAQGKPTGNSLGAFVRSDALADGVNTFSVEGSPVHLDPNTQYVLIFDFGPEPHNHRQVRLLLTSSENADPGGASSWSIAEESLSRVGTGNFITFGGQSLKFTISGYAGAAVRTVYDELEDYFSGTGTLSAIQAALQASGQTYYEKLSELVRDGEVLEHLPAGRSKVGADGTEGWHQVGTPSLPPGPSDTCGGTTVPGGFEAAASTQFYWECTQDGQWVPVKTPKPGVDYRSESYLETRWQRLGGHDRHCMYRVFDDLKIHYDEDGNPQQGTWLHRNFRNRDTGECEPPS